MFGKKKTPELYPATCLCGALLTPATFKALTYDLNVVDMTAFSCPVDGCDGNIAQKWTIRMDRIIDALCGGNK